MRFTLWDVEHGVSVWITTPMGHHHWLDLGKTAEFSPSRHVAGTYGVRDIDYLIISHPDKDHIEDLPNFLKAFSSLRILARNPSLPDKEFKGSGEADYQQNMYALHKHYTKPVPHNLEPKNPQYNGGIEYKQCYLNYGQFPDGTVLEGNNTSIVTFMLYKEVLFVCPGDIEPKGWIHLQNEHYTDLKSFIDRAKIKFLVAPHHGRESGYSTEMMDFIQPHVVFISDKWGASTTHRSYYEKPQGFIINNQITKCLSTKKYGRILCEIDNSGKVNLNQFENEKTDNTTSHNELPL